MKTYCIRPNYHTVRLGFSKLLEKFVVKSPPDKDYKEKDKEMSSLDDYLFNDIYAIFLSDFLYESICCW